MDVLHDNSHRTWIQLGDQHEASIPQYVMNYSLPDKTAASEIDDELFADPARRLFPVSDPALTWLSAAYFDKHSHAGDLPYKREESAVVVDAIKRAAEIHGIADDVQVIGMELHPEAEKQAESNDSNYGWVMRDEKTGEVVARKYPMFDRRGVEKASEYFNDYRSRYPQGVRRTIARSIMRKAAEYEMETEQLHDAVLKEAGFGIPRKDKLMEEIYERAHLTKDAEAAIALANINELVASIPDSEIGANLDKIAEVIDAFDRSADLTKHYGTRILMPADFLFDVNLKTAEAAVEDAIELDRHTFSLAKLAELPPQVYGDVLGEEFVHAIVKSSEETVDRQKLADNLFSLPVPDKAALEEHLAELFS
jgi:hypothetical protein